MLSNLQARTKGRAGPPDPPGYRPINPKTRLAAASRAVAIVQVAEQAAYVLQLRFNDGHISTVDFEPFLRRSRNPQTRQFLNRAQFTAYEIRDGNLVWGDYDMCFAIENLYAGTVDTRMADAKPILAVAEHHATYNTKSKNSRRKINPTTTAESLLKAVDARKESGTATLTTST